MNQMSPQPQADVSRANRIMGAMVEDVRLFASAWMKRSAHADQQLLPWQTVLLAVFGLLLLVFGLGFVVDDAASALARTFSPNVIDFFGHVTQLGASGYIFFLSVLIVVASVALRCFVNSARMRMALTLIAGRAFFIVAVNLVSGLFSLVAKNLIGRARPGPFGSFHFEPFTFLPKFASFPSGHSITIFATTLALALIMPRWRWPLLFVALSVGASRVIINTHYTSDVLAGAIFGAATTVLLARAFAARRIVFEPTSTLPKVRGAGFVASVVPQFLGKRS